MTNKLTNYDFIRCSGTENIHYVHVGISTDRRHQASELIISFVTGSTHEERCRRYRELFRVHPEPGLLDETRQASNGNYAPGGARFTAEIEAMLQRSATPGKAGIPVKVR